MAAKVSKEIVIHAPVDRFYDIVIDYDRYAEFVPGVKGCKVVKATREYRDVEYTVDLGIKTVRYVLRHLEHRPATVSWSLVKGEMMKVSNGAWELAADGNRTRALYTVEVQVVKPPLVPQALVDRVSDELTKVNLPRTLAAFKARAEKE
jgi:ribosome-associated toxin RatA of RatAB toxin-antitoxin module